jgi:hypothetical protein
VTVLRLWSSTWLSRCGGGGRRCQQRLLRWVAGAASDLADVACQACNKRSGAATMPALPGVPDGDWVCPASPCPQFPPPALGHCLR